MHNPTTVLQQLLVLLPEQEFETFVGQHNADRYTKSFSCWNQLTTMLYAQATEKDSLRDIEQGLSILDSTWQELGLKSASRSTIAYANKKRPAQIYESLFHALLRRYEGVLPNTKQFSFSNPLRAVDSSTVDLCLSLFPWAKFRTTKGAIKLHTSFDVRSQVPDVIVMTDGKVNDVTAIKEMDLSQFPPGTIFILDRGYVDYSLLQKIVNAGHHFVTRRKSNSKFECKGEHRPATAACVVKDERIALSSQKGRKSYPADLRLVTFINAETYHIYEFLTDMFHLSATNIAAIYKARWDIELFFKWIKQHLKIKTFFGTSRNAVLTQIWIAMIYYLLLRWLSAMIGSSHTILTLTRRIKTVCLAAMPLIVVLSCQPKALKRFRLRDGPQMSMF
jgi:hypothetical protein